MSIAPLSLIDDIIAITKCSSDAVVMNAFIETKTEDLQLKLGVKKCCQMHIGCKSSLTCPTLKVQNQEMMKSDKQQYLGDILSTDGKVDFNITERYNKGVGIVNQIITLLREVHFGKHYFEMALTSNQNVSFFYVPKGLGRKGVRQEWDNVPYFCSFFL